MSRQYQHELHRATQKLLRVGAITKALGFVARERLGITQEAIAERVAAIEEERAAGGGRPTGLRCPECQRISPARHAQCLYCGLEFERRLY